MFFQALFSPVIDLYIFYRLSSWKFKREDYAFSIVFIGTCVLAGSVVQIDDFLVDIIQAFLIFLFSYLVKKEKKVKFISYTDKLNKWYSAMDVLLFPSLYEGFGLVPLEAQVSNLPVLASDKVASEVFITKNINKIKGFNKEDWVRNLEEAEFKTNNARLKMNSSLNKFDVKKQATQISKLIENQI